MVALYVYADDTPIHLHCLCRNSIAARATVLILRRSQPQWRTVTLEA